MAIPDSGGRAVLEGAPMVETLEVGLPIKSVFDGSLAQELELAPGDRVEAVNGQEIRDAIDAGQLTGLGWVYPVDQGAHRECMDISALLFERALTAGFAYAKLDVCQLHLAGGSLELAVLQNAIATVGQVLENPNRFVLVNHGSNSWAKNAANYRDPEAECNTFWGLNNRYQSKSCRSYHRLCPENLSFAVPLLGDKGR